MYCKRHNLIVDYLGGGLLKRKNVKVDRRGKKGGSRVQARNSTRAQK